MGPIRVELLRGGLDRAVDHSKEVSSMARVLSHTWLAALTVGAGLAVLGCEGGQTPLAADRDELTPAEAAEVEHQVVRTPIEDLVVDDPCVGELVSYDGFSQFVFHVGRNRGLDAPDFQHRIDNSILKLSGEGLTSGAKYQVTGPTAFHVQAEDVVETFPLSLNLVGKTLVTRQGEGVVSLLKLKFTVVIDSNDQIRVDRFEITSECP